jgi:hypothetical protein
VGGRFPDCPASNTPARPTRRTRHVVDVPFQPSANAAYEERLVNLSNDDPFRMTILRVAGAELIEYICPENNKDVAHRVGEVSLADSCAGGRA